MFPYEWDIKYCLPMIYFSIRLVNTRDFIKRYCTLYNHNVSQRIRSFT